MLQRIQTLFLLIALTLIAAMFFMPLAEFIIDGQVYVFTYRDIGIGIAGAEPLFKSYALAILLIVILLLILVTIFLFKNRRLQMRLCVYNMLLNLGFYGLFYFYYHQVVSTNQIIYSFAIASVFPLIAIILLWLAFRAIRKDEILVKSVDRIR